MTLALYMDHHVPRAITEGLRLRDVDFITALENGTDRLDDPDLLDRASQLERVLFTRDADFLEETHRRLDEGVFFYGEFMHTNFVFLLERVSMI
jgi:predicted nuclease of predicted toxin-antitoxin system